MTTTLRWLAAHKIEAAVLVIGVLVRASMLWNFDVLHGFDANFHWQCVAYTGVYGAPAPRDLNCTSYNPSLYYALAAIPYAWFDANIRDIQTGSVWLGIAQLFLVQWALQRWVRSRFARVIALLVAATLPATVHIDGLVTPETLSKLLSTISLILAAMLLESADPHRRMRLAAWLGLSLGLGLLTKVSATSLLPAFGIAALADALYFPGDLRAKLRRFAPMCVAFLLAAAPATPMIIDNMRSVGHPLPTSFDAYQKYTMVEIEQTPIWARQQPHFFFGWNYTMFQDPFAPRASARGDKVEFWSVLVASTFLDHWNYRFSPPAKAGEPSVKRNAKPLRPLAWQLGVAAFAGGTVVFVTTIVALVLALRDRWRRRDFAMVAMLLAPCFAVLALMFFSTKYPINFYGTVKGLYVQFAGPPLYALFGVAVAHLWSRRRLRPVAVVALAGYAPVLIYTLYCRLGTWFYDVFLYSPK
jgi:4-amino-4-deoxy-L-arabinose transferase-like glycosyltransferase